MTLGPDPRRWELPDLEEFEERAAIIAADTGCTREESERQGGEDRQAGEGGRLRVYSLTRRTMTGTTRHLPGRPSESCSAVRSAESSES